MNFSECLSKVATDRLRGARRLWSTDEWYRAIDRDGSRWLVFVAYLDGRAFGLPALPVDGGGSDVALGPLVIVNVRRMPGSGDPGLPGVSLATYMPAAEDMLALDWEIVDDARVAAVLKAIQTPKES